jgi:cytochrome c biogenesis protein CcmG/thiol:disulfide interchange protein DsbE
MSIHEEDGSNALASDEPSALKLPRGISALLIGTIVAATLLALIRSGSTAPDIPPAVETAEGPIVGAITEDVAQPDAAGRIGAAAPDFVWVTAQSTTTRLSALRGRPVVLNFWATWCVPCRAEMPALDRLAAERPDVMFLAVDLQEDAGTVRRYFTELGLTALVPLLDGRGAITRRYGVLSLPTTFFLDREGVIRHIEIGGPLSEERLRADLTKIAVP